MTKIDSDRQVLETFIVDNSELERLETLLGEFNIFEALGAVRSELRHSDFLAFLLDPRQNHGLGDDFVKALLKYVLVSTTSAPVSPIDLDFWDLDEIIILREWQNIDILLIDERNQFLVLIENKINTGEHSNQLERYYQIGARHHPDKKIVPVFLTPEGDLPSDERYIPISYQLIADVVQLVIEKRASTIGPEVLTALNHYQQMLRRHILKESEIAELCRKIYRKHKRALDLIFEYRPDLQQDIREFLEDLIQETEGLQLAHSTKSNVRFIPAEWDVPPLKGSVGWVPEGHILLFELSNSANSLILRLVVGPGRPELSSKLFELAKQTPPLRTLFKKRYEKWNTLYTNTFLSKADLNEASIDDLKPKIIRKWKAFLDKDLPEIKSILRTQSWLWEEEITDS